MGHVDSRRRFLTTCGLGVSGWVLMPDHAFAAQQPSPATSPSDIVKAVVHCHTASLIPFGVTGIRLRPIYHQSAFLVEGVPVFEIRTAAGMTDMLIKDGTLGRALARTLGGKPAALM